MNKTKLIIILVIQFYINIISQSKITDYVNPFIGTDEHGHTFPGATLPFGMVQLSPDTDTEGWDWCSGYHYSDNSIIGFSHTHLSGTGCGDYGDILFMPIIGGIKTKPGSKENPDEGYRSRFSHKNEIAKPGYYSVFLDDYKINVELTATTRAGFHKYTFPESKNSYVLIDLTHGIQDKVLDSYIEIVNDRTVQGYRRSTGWAKDHTIYFYAEFSKPFISHKIVEQNIVKDDLIKSSGTDIKAFFEYKTKSNESILIKVGISHTSLEGAKNNLYKEIPHWNFNEIKKNVEKEWEKQLSIIKVEDDNENKKVIFYTAMYHAFISPNILSDVDGSYIGMDGKIHYAKDFTMYTVYSLWDTFRALHPLLTIVDRKRTVDMIKSLIAKYEESGLLPVWELASNETGTMIGYHSIPVIVDAYLKGITNFDIHKAYESMKKSSLQNKHGLEYYREMGYIPSDMEHESVSKTLEYCYDDWCIAQVAKFLNKEEDYINYIERSKYYINLFDPVTKFFRPKKNGKWVEPFDPYFVSRDFTEANAWQYLFFVPHDIETLIKLMGGEKEFEKKLDELFTAESKLYGKYQPDISGLIGQYAHGNEPSHHIAYLYNYIGKPWKTQKIINDIRNKFYTENPDGLIGNEDCGQMSAWYVFSSLGFYPVCPGDNNYVIGTPNFKKVSIKVDKNKYFTIIANQLSPDNCYIKNVKLNDADYQKSYLRHSSIIKGGKLVFEMSSKPSNRASEKDNCPSSYVNYGYLPIPFLIRGEKVFRDSTIIEIAAIDSSDIFYSFEESKLLSEWIKYDKPFVISNSAKLKFASFKNGKFSKSVLSEFYKIPEDWSIIYNSKFSNSYQGGGHFGLIDGIRGTENFNSDAWQGYEGDNLDVVIDLGKIADISYINTSFLQAIGSWIFYPVKVEYYYSIDGNNFSKIYEINLEESINKKVDGIKNIEAKIDNLKTRYVKVVAKNIGICPSWHIGSGKKAWLFVDEISIK